MRLINMDRSQDDGNRSTSIHTTLKVIPRQAGMTLVEIMIVLTIMAGVMGFAAYNVVGYMKNAKIKEASAEVEQIRGFIESYHLIHGNLPRELSQLEEEVDGYGSITERMPNDPWDSPYEYSTSNDNSYTLYSMGPDGQSGSQDDIYPENMEPR